MTQPRLGSELGVTPHASTHASFFPEGK